MHNSTNKNLAQTSALLTDQGLTIAVAESCTSGLIQNLFSTAENAMKFFQGGITTYNIGQKAKHLKINPIKAEENNAVSEEICQRMAIEVAMLFNSEIGIAITGYAQPIPEQNINECFALMAISKDSKIINLKKIEGDASQNLGENQRIYSQEVLEELLKTLQK